MRKRDYTIQSVQKALRVLQAFSPAAPELGAQEIAARVGFPMSVTFKLARTLAAEGFLQQDPLSRRYRIGPGILAVTGAYLSSSPLHREGNEALRAVARTTGHTATLGIRDGHEVLFIAVAEGTHVVRASAGIGDRRPAYATATGKVLLSDLDDDEIRRLYEGRPMVPYTPRTVANVDALLRDVRRVRRRGLAYNLHERTADASAVAAPIRDFTGRVIAGMAVIFPAARETQPFIREVSRHLQHHATELSRRLGMSAAPSVANGVLRRRARAGQAGEAERSASPM
jgi:DNA-binding IclR family transcriptional regulator